MGIHAHVAQGFFLKCWNLHQDLPEVPHMYAELEVQSSHVDLELAPQRSHAAVQ